MGGSVNVIVSNQQREVLAGLDIDVIKSVSGEFDADEIVNMFRNFFFGRMILDVTAIKDYQNVANLQKISMNLDVEKIILFLPNLPEVSSSSFLSKLISMGYYNFTTNLDGLKYLLDHPNSYKDVAHIQQLNELSDTVVEKVVGGSHVIGVKNITDHAGSTTLIYMLKKELEQTFSMTVVAIEIGKRDFGYFNEKKMISITKDQFAMELLKHKDADVILVDLNDSDDDAACHDVLYLIEPSSIKLNKLMRRDRTIFEKLKGKKIVLNKSLLNHSDIMDFEYEARAKVFYNIPPVNDRERNNIFHGLLTKMGIVQAKTEKEEKGKILGLFKF